MCDYSLHLAASRPAKVEDKLVVKDFGTMTNGFAAVGEPDVAVCLLPGTELAFENNVRFHRSFNPFWSTRTGHKVARFRKVNEEKYDEHHDALEFPNGQIVLLTQLASGQKATVLQLPASAAREKVSTGTVVIPVEPVIDLQVNSRMVHGVVPRRALRDEHIA